ncbi:hypothetical protein ACFCWG_27940 [Streptomyces sp. NPDC056390]
MPLWTLLEGQMRQVELPIRWFTCAVLGQAIRVPLGRLPGMYAVTEV